MRGPRAWSTRSIMVRRGGLASRWTGLRVSRADRMRSNPQAYRQTFSAGIVCPAADTAMSSYRELCLVVCAARSVPCLYRQSLPRAGARRFLPSACAGRFVPSACIRRFVPRACTARLMSLHKNNVAPNNLIKTKNTLRPGAPCRLSAVLDTRASCGAARPHIGMASMHGGHEPVTCRKRLAENAGCCDASPYGTRRNARAGAGVPLCIAADFAARAIAAPWSAV